MKKNKFIDCILNNIWFTLTLMCMLSTKKTSNNEIFKLVNQINLLCSVTLTKSYTDLRLTYITKGDTQRAKLPLL